MKLRNSSCHYKQPTRREKQMSETHLRYESGRENNLRKKNEKSNERKHLESYFFFRETVSLQALAGRCQIGGAYILLETKKMSV